MPDAVILDARPDDLAAHVAKAAVERNGQDPGSVDEVLASMRELGFRPDKLNVNGSAIALGPTAWRPCASGWARALPP